MWLKRKRRGILKILKSFQLLLILGLVLVLAACGGDDDSSNSDSNDDAQSNVSENGGRVEQVQTLGDEPVREIAVSPNGESFVVATDSALTQISLVDEGQSSVALDQARFLAISSDGSKVAGYSAGNRHVMLWDVGAGTTLGLEGLPAAVQVTFSPNDAYLVGVAIGEPTVLVMWSVESGDVVWSIDREATESEDGGASAAFSPDGQQVAVGLYDGSLSLRDVATGEVVQRYGGHTTDDELTNIVSVAFAPDGSTITSVR